jgi:hypothetical protein
MIGLHHTRSCACASSGILKLKGKCSHDYKSSTKPLFLRS